MERQSLTRVAYPLAVAPPYLKGNALGKNGKDRTGPKIRDHMTPRELEVHDKRQAYSARRSNAFLRRNASTAQKMVRAVEAATPDQIHQGRNWYPGANHAAHQIAADASRNTGRDVTADQVVGLMAVYSGQTKWHDNLHEASLAAHGVFPGTGGEGWKDSKNKGFMTTNAQSEQARRIMNGEDWREVLKGQKVSSFGQNISTGGIGRPKKEGEQDDQDRPTVTIDRHMISALHGNYADEGVYVQSRVSSNRTVYNDYVDKVVKATDIYNKRYGTKLQPTDFQAIAWLVTQDSNEKHGYNNDKEDLSQSKIALASKERWNEYADGRHAPEIHDKTPGVGYSGAGAIAVNKGADIPVFQTYHGMPTAAQGGSPGVTPPIGPIGKNPVPPDPREAISRVPYLGLQTQSPVEAPEIDSQPLSRNPGTKTPQLVSGSVIFHSRPAFVRTA